MRDQLKQITQKDKQKGQKGGLAYQMIDHKEEIINVEDDEW